MALDKDQQAQLLKVGRSIGLEPRVGESWPEYQRRIREKQPEFANSPQNAITKP